MRKTESVIDHYSKVNVRLHDILVSRFMVTTKEEKVDDAKLMKLAGSIGFMQQTQSALQKNIYNENDIKDIYRILNRIPPEILQAVNNPIDPTILVPIENN